MQINHMPRVNARYWSAITMASLFGTNLGDLYAYDSGFGLIGGVPILAVLAAAVFLIERRDPTPRELYYWLLIIIIRTGATNLADYFQDQMPWPVLGALLTVTLAGFAWASLRGSDPAEERAAATKGLPGTGGYYWAAMLSAGVFGTLFGDVAQHLIGQGTAAVFLGALLLVALALWRVKGTSHLWVYWLTVAVARTAGTAMGDFLAESDLLAIGLPLSTLITGTVFSLIVLLWPRQSKAAPTPFG